MITRFKIFEGRFVDSDLAEQFSQKYVEDFFDDNYQIDASEASRSVRLWDFVDDIDKIREDLISDLITDALHNDEMSKSDYILYIKEYQLENTIPILNKYRKKLVLGDIKYEDILKKLTKEQLVDIVAEKLDKSDDFFKNYYHDKYDDIHPEYILNDIWGEASVEQNLYDLIKSYVNDEEIIEYFKDKLDFTYKLEYLQDYICCDRKLQKDLFVMNPNNVDDLFDVMNKDGIGNDYDFQKAYVQKNSNEESIVLALKSLYDKFGLNPKIENEYKDYMYEIDSIKYNL